MQIAGGVGFSYLFHVKCDIIRVLVGPTNGWCVNKISSKLLWLLSSLSKGKILNCDYHYWLVREHYIFSWFFCCCCFFYPSASLSVFSKPSVFFAKVSTATSGNVGLEFPS